MRKSLAAAIGYFQEQASDGVLSRLLTDEDAAVAQAALRSVELVRNPGTEITGSGDPSNLSEWMALLEELSAFRLTDSRLLARLSGGAIARSWLGELGAAESQITTLEQRIGRRLPPSYRSFLMASNGFLAPDSFISGLYGTESVDWFRVRHADWAHPIERRIPTSVPACR